MDDMVLSGAEVGISKVVSVERDQDGIKKVELESLLLKLELDVGEAVTPDAEVQDLPPLGRNALFENPHERVLDVLGPAAEGERVAEEAHAPPSFRVFL